MHRTVSMLLVALLSFTASALPEAKAAPAPIASSVCVKDAVYLALVAPAIASTASQFCSSYIRPTATATKTVTQPVTATVTATVTTATIIQKRATINLSTFAPASLLSSACSCLLVTALPPATTVYPFTRTIITTVATATKTQNVIETCSSAAFTSPLQNGDFSQNDNDWTVIFTAPPDCSGYGMYYGFNENDAGFFFAPQCYNTGLTLSQTLTTCAGAKYSLTATFKSEFCNLFRFMVDGQVVIDGSNQACGEGVYPYLDYGPYHTVTGVFTPYSNTPNFTVAMLLTNGQVNTFRIQSIAIAPSS